MDTCTAARHDTRRAYEVYGCRCPNAVEANRRHAANRVPGRGIHRQGPPVGDIDEAAVHLCVTGQQLVALTQAELQVAMDQLDTGHLTVRAVARHLGVAERTVRRHRARRKRQAATQSGTHPAPSPS